MPNFPSPNRKNVATRQGSGSNQCGFVKPGGGDGGIGGNWLTRLSKLAKALQNAKETGMKDEAKEGA